MDLINISNEGRNSTSDKVLYVIHVDWASPTKGRPQLLAQGLGARVPIRVLHRRSYRAGSIRESLGIDNSAMLALPFERFALVRTLNRGLFLLQLLFELLRGRPRTLWITHPRFTPPRCWLSWFSIHLVYDCMDDLLAFGEVSAVSARGEPYLLKMADLVIASAENLAVHLIERGSAPLRTKVVRNGLRSHWLQISGHVTSVNTGANYIALYFGSVENWFDFPAVLLALDQITNLEVHLLGPVFVPLPEHPRLRALGAVSHGDLLERARGADVLIMPFLLTDLIRSVDPVKLYEYVALGLPILARGYAEIEQFRPFAHFYDTAESFSICLKSLIAGQNKDEAPGLRSAFLETSTWDSRAEEVLACLKILESAHV